MKVCYITSLLGQNIFVNGCFSFCLYDIVVNFLKNRTIIGIERQAFASFPTWLPGV